MIATSAVITPYHGSVEQITLLTSPGEIPKDRKTIPDDAFINIRVWAALQGVKVGSVHRNRTAAEARRKAGESRPGDMPPAAEKETQTLGFPVWSMASYRAWEKNRPGKGAGAGRPKGSGKNLPPNVVRLPVDCPHCGKEITRYDVADVAEPQDADA